MSEPQEFGGLLWQIHELKQQLADAEKRGAVKALRAIAEQYDDERVPLLTTRGNVAMAARDYAHLIESGQVTL